MDDLSSSSSVTTVAFDRLTAGDLALIEEIVDRAPVTGLKGLMNVFDQVLAEHGLDEQADGLCYNVLLKLTSIRAPSYREKWEILKKVNGVVGGGRRWDDEAPTERSASPLESDAEESEGTAEPGPARRHMDSPIVKARAYRESTPAPAVIPHATHKPALRHPLPTPAPSEASRAVHWRDDKSVARPTPVSRPAVPSTSTSQRTALRSQPTPSLANASRRLFSTAGSPPRLKSSVAPAPRASAAGRPGQSTAKPLAIVPGKAAAPVLNAEPEEANGPDAWQLMKMERDADDFRRDVALYKCFQRWRGRTEVLLDNYAEVARALSEVNLRNSLACWRAAIARHRELIPRAVNVDRVRRLMEFWRLWKDRIHARRQKLWQENMRQRLLSVRYQIQSRLIRETWEKWLQAHRTRRAVLFHNAVVLERTLTVWTDKSSQLRELSSWADEVRTVKEERVYRHVWDTWKHSARLRVVEWAVVRRGNFHRVAEAFDQWRRNAQDNALANALYKRSALEGAIHTWRSRLSTIKALSRRARMFADVRDKVLQFSALKTWVSEERCVLVVRVMEKRLVASALQKWSEKTEAVAQMEDRAMECVYEIDCKRAIEGYQRWKSRLDMHRNTYNLSSQYHAVRLSAHMIARWKEAVNQLSVDRRRARMAHQALLLTSTWKTWQTALARRRQEQWLVKADQSRLREAFKYWAVTARRDRTHKLLVQAIQAHANSRVKASLLSNWVIRTADLKLQNMRAAEAADAKLLRGIFSKWTDHCERHHENVSLMYSFRDVKQEDQLRKTFQHWLNSARRTRARRRRLQRREQEAKLATISVAWEAWRDRFRERQLRDAEWEVLIRSQRLTLTFAFNHWKKKSQFLPAVRFSAMQVRGHVWKVWRAALPNAQRARQAAVLDKRNLLSNTFNAWKSAYKTSIAKKAIARARAMRTSRMSLPAFPVAAIHSIPGSSSSRRLPPTPSDSDTSPPSPNADLPEVRANTTVVNGKPGAALPVTPYTTRTGDPATSNVTPRDRLWRELLKARSESRKR